MAETPEAPIPELVEPPKKKFTVPPEFKDDVDRILSIRYVTGIDMIALLCNAISALLIFFLFFLVISKKTDNAMLTIGIPMAITWTSIVLVRSRIWTKVNARTAKVFLNTLSKKITVYTQGFHFVPWFSTMEPDEVNFQKHELIAMEKKNGTEIRFPSKDGYEMFVDLQILFRRREGQEAMSRSLNYQLADIQSWTQAVVIGRLSDLGGCNPYEVLLHRKAEVTAWVANLFGGEDKISDFEDELGISVKDPVLKGLDLTEESKKTFGVRAKIDVITEGIKKLRKLDISPDEAAITAQAAEGAATRVVHTYQGVPQSAKVVALGDTGIAIAAKGGK